MITYAWNDEDAEIISLNVLIENRGIGSRLIQADEQEIEESGRKRVWLITTNDNLDALRFYQRKGYRLAAIYVGAVDEMRKEKPTIPLVGNYDIPLHDEIELEKRLNTEHKKNLDV